MNDTVGIVGSGRMAQAMARLLHLRGERVVGVAGRTRAHVEQAAHFIGTGVDVLDLGTLVRRSQSILIAVSDDALHETARQLAEVGMRSGVAIHTAGVHGPEALEILAGQGVSCGSLHPLQSVASPPQGVRDLVGAWFAVAACGSAGETARRWVSRLEGHLILLSPGGNPLYHAAAVMVSNYTTALLAAALELMDAAGIDEEAARRCLGPLARTSLQNALKDGPVSALTGPVMRGDARTILLHLEAMQNFRVPETVRDLYRAAGMQAARVAGLGGLPVEALQAVQETLKGEAHATGPSSRSESHETAR